MVLVFTDRFHPYRQSHIGIITGEALSKLDVLK
jgi:hypothetical protein